MEWWFIVALLATFFAGMHAFVQKVTVVRGHDPALIAGISAFLSGVLALIASFVFLEWEPITGAILLFAFLNAVLHQSGMIARMHGLRFIDTTIFFPLYKVLSPIIVIVIGLGWYGELFTITEWWGIALSLLVPLLLISRQENIRQNHLVKGLWFVIISSSFVAFAAAITKEATLVADNIVLWAAWANMIAGVFGLLIYKWNHRGSQLKEKIKEELTLEGVKLIVGTGVIQFFSFVSFLYAIYLGSLGIVYTIHSLYILIPIVLSIMLYSEHWNARKVAAIALSILALGLLG